MRNRLIRWIISLAIAAGVGAAMYSHMRGEASRGVKAEIMLMIDEITLEPAWRPEIKRLVNCYHETAFAASLDIRKELGRKFDSARYMDELFDRIVAYVRQEGHTRMADQLDRERRAFSLGTTEE